MLLNSIRNGRGWPHETIIAHDGFGTGLDLGATGPRSRSPHANAGQGGARAGARIQLDRLLPRRTCWLGLGTKDLCRYAERRLGGLLDWGVQSSLDVDTDGFLGGGQIGCDYQFATNWVIGVEGNFSWANISGSSSPPAFIGTETFDAKTDWLASVTGRLGYAWDRWLLYAKGGAAWAHDKYNITTYLGTWATSETRSGWTVGGGLEWAFANNWSAKLEYQFYDFGNRDLTLRQPWISAAKSRM